MYSRLCSVLIAVVVLFFPVLNSNAAVLDNKVINDLHIEMDEIPVNITFSENDTAVITMPGKIICDLTAHMRTVVAEVVVDIGDWEYTVEPGTFEFRGTGVFEEPFNIYLSTPPLPPGLYSETITIFLSVHEDPGIMMYTTVPIMGTIAFTVVNNTLEEQNMASFDSGGDGGSIVVPVMMIAIVIGIIVFVIKKREVVVDKLRLKRELGI